jgi:predicted N-acetyltransferase YhbS
MSVRRELLKGLERLNATTFVLQRARLAEPNVGIWDAADIQWWWRRPRSTDDLALPVWFDEFGPVAAVGICAWDDTWQTDAFVASSIVPLEVVWNETMTIISQNPIHPLRLILPERNNELIELALQSGFKLTDEISGTTWLNIDDRPKNRNVDGFTVVDRTIRAQFAHPMVARNGELVESRLKECSLYDPTLDLAIEDKDGNVAGYALFWFDKSTLVGMLEPMRIEEIFQRRGLASALITTGLDRLAGKGARTVKVGFESEAASSLYFASGFVQTSVDRLLTRSLDRYPIAST